MILDLVTPVVHMVVGQSRSDSGGGLTVETKCGLTSSRPTSEPKPGDFSIWPSDTTCEACQR